MHQPHEPMRWRSGSRTEYTETEKPKFRVVRVLNRELRSLFSLKIICAPLRRGSTNAKFKNLLSIRQDSVFYNDRGI